MSHREPGVVTLSRAINFRGGPKDPPNTHEVFIDFDGGSAQAFGGLYLPDEKHLSLWRKMLFAAAGVKSDKEMEGLKVFALRAFSAWNEPIAGLEFENGNRFTVRQFRHALDPGKKQPTALEEAREKDQRHLKSLKRQLREFEEKLVDDSLENDYVEWG